VFLLTGATIRSWTKRADEEGPGALVQLRAPVNKFPDFVQYVVARLKVLCPTMGKMKIAQLLARAGLHLGVTTVGRILHKKCRPTPTTGRNKKIAERIVTARYANHVWHVDLTVMPTQAGMWAAWLPFALPQCWPLCWWLGLCVDHFSRRMMGFALFKTQPTSRAVRAMLAQTIAATGVCPKYMICDKGSQFWCDAFKAWCHRRAIRPRFGAVGQYGSLAILERAILSLKQICRREVLVRVSAPRAREELEALMGWFNEHRPHSGIGGRTPNEMYYGRRPANRQPRFEPRPVWPRGSPCARPWALIRGKSGARVELDVQWYAGRKHLPIVQLRRVA
jgi:putative transposase